MADKDSYKQQHGKWEKQYEKEGLNIFSPENIGILKAIQARYSTTYTGFFYALASKFPGENTAKDLIEAAQAAKSVAAHIGVLLGSRGRRATPAEIDTLFDMMAKVAAKVEYYKAQMARDNKLAQTISSVEQTSGVTVDELQFMTRQTEKRIAGMKSSKEGAPAYFKRVAPEVYETAQDIMGGVAGAALGPFAGIAKMAVGGITGIAKDFYRKRVEAEKRKFITGLNPMAMGMGIEGLMGVGGARGRGERVGQYVRPEGVAGGILGGLGGHRPGGTARADVPGMGGRRAPAVSVGSIASDDMYPQTIADGMFIFFDKIWIKAKWTRDIYDAIKKGGFGGGKKGMSLLDLLGLQALWGLVAPFLLGTVLPAVLAALAGLGLGWLLSKLFPGLIESINKFLDTFNDRMGKWFGEIGQAIAGFALAGPTGFAGNLVDLFMKNKDSVKEGLGQVPWSGLTGFFGAFTADLVGKSKAWLDDIGVVDTMLAGFSGLGAKIGEFIAQLTKDFSWITASITGLGAQLADSIHKQLPNLKDVAGSFAAAGMTGVGEQALEAIQKVSPAFLMGGPLGSGFDLLKGTMAPPSAEEELALGLVENSGALDSRVNVGKSSEGLPSIPIVLAGGAGLFESIKGLTDVVSKDLKSIVADVKQAIPKNVSAGRASDVDAYGTRDTITEAMNTGLLGVED